MTIKENDVTGPLQVSFATALMRRLWNCFGPTVMALLNRSFSAIVAPFAVFPEVDYVRQMYNYLDKVFHETFLVT